MTTLTEKQIQIIKDTWEVPKKDMEGSGEAILFRYFEKYPHNQQKFPSFKNLPLDSLKVSSRKYFVFLGQRWLVWLGDFGCAGGDKKFQGVSKNKFLDC